MSDLLTRLRYHGKHCLDRNGEQSETMLQAAAEIERLRAALHRYGLHTWDCAWSDSRGEKPCDCGWSALEQK